MSTIETIAALTTYNAWRRGDELLEMPSPREIGEMIDAAIALLRRHDEMATRATEAEAVKTLYSATLKTIANACIAYPATATATDHLKLADTIGSLALAALLRKSPL